MTLNRWYVEHTQSWTIMAESEEEALQIVRDGGGTGEMSDWYATEIEAEEPEDV